MPSYTDGHRFTFRDRVSLFIAAGLLVAGLLSNNSLQTMLGGLLLLYLLFTRQRSYELSAEMLIVRYLAPRTQRVLLADVKSVEHVDFPFAGPGVLIARSRGRRLFITPRDPEAFFMELRARIGSPPAGPP
jgi:hypothetical protein